MASLQFFEDILEPRRTEIFTYKWASRKLTPKVPFKQRKKVQPEDIKQAVLNSSRIQIMIEKEREKRNVSRNTILTLIKHILDEIGYNRNLPIIRWLGLFLAKVCSQVCTGIYINKISISKLRNDMGNVPVMYVPSHRSYADFILLSYICFHYDIEIPAIAAGMDFHGMWGMGDVLRNTGAFFIRRTFNDDNLYWETFREYVHQLVAKGELGIEFFIEGTRSRSSKSLFPKLGLLSMVLKAFFNGEIPDILFVPINISYERVMEERLFAFELLGVPKPKESTSAFFKSLSLVKEKYGNVYVNFGSPISAHQYFGNRIDRSVHCMKPLHLETVTENEKDVTVLLAQSIVKSQQKLCVITTFNLIAIAFIDSIIYKKETLHLGNLMKEMVWLNSVIEKFGALTNFNNTEQAIVDSLQVHQNFVRLEESGDIGIVQNNIVLEKIDKTKLKGHVLSEETMTKAVPFVLMQIYVNATLHYFVNPALLTIILRKSYIDNGVINDTLFTEYSFLRALLSKEFVLFPMNEQMEYEESLLILEKTDIITSRSDIIYVNANGKLQILLSNLMQPFFLTYYIMCTLLSNTSSGDWSEKLIFSTTQFHIEKILNNSKFSIHPYTLSLDIISNGLQSLVDLNAVQRIRRNNSVVYNVHQSLSIITTKLYEYVMHLIPGFSLQIAAKL